MFQVKEMRKLAMTLPREDFLKQLGPFVLIQRPPPEVAESRGISLEMPMATAPTGVENMSAHTLSLLFEFEDLLVATLPPLVEEDELLVGRLPDCELLIEHPSVSKRHALVRWYNKESRCTVMDLQSTNGTFLNASVMVKNEATLKDGDILSFGDVQFWYLLSTTLHSRLSTQSGWHKLGSHSG